MRLRNLLWATTFVAAAAVTGCSSEGEMGTSPTRQVDRVQLLRGFAAPQTREDSIVLHLNVGRQLALSLKEPAIRLAFREIIRVSSVPEKKTHLQRFLANNGRAFGRAVGQTIEAEDSAWIRPTNQLRDLEVYLPVPTHRMTWDATADILVLPMVYSDDELRTGGKTLQAFDVDGRTHLLHIDTIPERPVIVLVHVERASIFGPDGQSQATGLGGLRAAECEESPHMPPDPECEGAPEGGSANVCGGLDSTHTQLYVCRIEIANVDGYEGWPRGNPEIAIAVFEENNSSDHTSGLGCANEAADPPRAFNQDSDIWNGHVLLTTFALVQSKIAAGKHPIIWVWEEDEGRFCSFDPEGAEDGVQAPTIVQLSGWALGTMLAGYLNSGPVGVYLTVLWGGFNFINAFSDDDFIGTVGLDDPSVGNPRAIVRQLSSPPPLSIRGYVWFETVP